MKITYSLYVLLLAISPLFSQNNFPAGSVSHGVILPSIGTVNTLIIFAQFPDDNYDTSNVLWPKGKAPADEDKWISETWTDNPVQGSLTHYFNDMSFNKFKFIGKTVSVIAPHTRQWYLDSSLKRGDIQKDIILQLNKKMNFAEFDNWKWVADYKQANQPDGMIDMIIFIWRNIARELPDENLIKTKLEFSNDIATLGGFKTPQSTYNYVFTVDNGSRKVNTIYSGVTIRNYLPDRNITFKIVVHEVSHYLLGDESYHSGFGFWGMLPSYGIKSIVANSFERSQLGWIKLKNISGRYMRTISSIKLSDYATTGEAVSLEIDSSSGQYFYIENHQDISYWETQFKLGNIEKGLYVIRKDRLTPSNSNDNPASANMRLIPASGRFDWDVEQQTNNPWGSDPVELPVFNKLKPDRINGYSDLDYIPYTWDNIKQKGFPVYFTEDKSGNAQLDIKLSGDGYDAFRIGYNEVFSPWSNPNSYTHRRIPTPFGFKIDSLKDGSYYIDVYVNTSIEAPPSKPFGLTAAIDSTGNYINLTWQPNIEPDLSSYEISRKIGDEWNIIGITKDSSFADTSIYSISSENHLTTSYRVRAKDIQNFYSIYSDSQSINTISVHKITSVDEKTGIKEYKLYQNYPNPFNPSTTIKYSIPHSAHVILKVYDILGREAAVLVNEQKAAGTYKIDFNASSLASGIYVYKIEAGNYSDVKKFVLLK